MGYLKLDLDSLTSLAAKLRQAAYLSEEELAKESALLAPSAVWEGQVPTPYVDRFLALQRARRDLIESQRALAQIVAGIVRNMESVDSSGALAFMDAPASSEARTSQGGSSQSGYQVTSDSVQPVLEIPVDAYLDTDDFAAASAVFSALDKVLGLVGRDHLVEIEIVHGSIWRRAKALMRKGLSSPELQSRLVKLERALELAQLDNRQAEVDMKLSGAVSDLLASITDIPQACLRVGSLLIVKYTNSTGTVVLSRNLSQPELRALENFPEIQKRPSEVLSALASAISLYEIEEIS